MAALNTRDTKDVVIVVDHGEEEAHAEVVEDPIIMDLTPAHHHEVAHSLAPEVTPVSTLEASSAN